MERALEGRRQKVMWMGRRSHWKKAREAVVRAAWSGLMGHLNIFMCAALIKKSGSVRISRTQPNIVFGRVPDIRTEPELSPASD